MPESRLSTRWRLELELLSPLHVGAGGPRLLADYDFVARGGEVWVVDLDRALDRLPDERLAGEVDARLSALLRPADFAECARYRLQLRGSGTPAEIIPFVRDVYDRPYLPGSSLKGAFRTAVAWAMVFNEREGRLDLRELDRRQQYAARSIERGLLGPDPNRDLLRALRVSDLALEGEPEAELAVAAVYTLRGGRLEPKGQGYRWHVETLPAGTRLVGSLSLDEHLFGPQTRALPFNGQRKWLAELPDHCLDFSYELAMRESEFYQQAGLGSVAGFYRRLAERSEDMGYDDGMLQLGWGTGWTAKTLGPLLQDHPDFPEVVSRYHLDRDRGAPVFPKTRRLVERGNTPELPLGWARFQLCPDSPLPREGEGPGVRGLP